MKKALLLIVCFLCAVAHADIIVPKAWQNALHTKVQINKKVDVKYPLIHLENPKGTPVILLNGFGGNEHNWMDIGTDLHHAGYDVWAFGWTRNVDRNVDEAGSKTIKEIAEYVFARTGKKSFLVGHSLGGIAAKIYLYGVKKNPLTGKYHESLLAKLRAKKIVKGFVSMSAPNGKGIDSSAKYARLFKLAPTFDLLGYPKLSDLINASLLKLDLLVVKSFDLPLTLSKYTFLKELLDSLVNLDNFEKDKYQLAKHLRYGYSPISKPCKDQVVNLLESGDIYSSDGAIDYLKLFFETKTPVPSLYMVGELDDLAVADTVADEARSQNSRFVEIKNVGHIDIIMGDQRKETARAIKSFLRKYR